jgi:hypothetical protein
MEAVAAADAAVVFRFDVMSRCTWLCCTRLCTVHIVLAQCQHLNAEQAMLHHSTFSQTNVLIYYVALLLRALTLAER